MPTRPPDTTGVLEGGALVDSADDYYEGMAVPTEDVLVVDRAGERIAATELVDGQSVEVWIGDSCAESYPVQCTVVALRVAAAPD